MRARPGGANVPVIMYHGAGPILPNWLWEDLTCPLPLFERQLALLSARGYRTASLSDLRRWQEEGRPPPDRRLVLTFDDGYLDNWTYVYPLLERIGWQATVYVNPDFVDPAPRPRPTLADVWAGRCAEAELSSRGFMSWAELRQASREGVLEVACHSRTHTWYETGPEVVDYHRPGSPRPWLAWNAAPERKHAYLREDQSGLVPWGTPVHAHGRSLGVRRWFPPAGLAEACARFVAERGGAEFFARPGWRDQLDGYRDSLRLGAGRAETDAEMMERFQDEIVGARDLMARELGAAPRHFAWPGGAYNDVSWRVAEQAGFETMTVRSTDTVRWRSSDPSLLRRGSCFSFVTLRGRRFPNDDARVLWHACEAARGSAWHRFALRAAKLRIALTRRQA